VIITVLPFLNDKPIKLFRFFLLASAACFLSVPAGAAVIYSGLQNIPIATGFDGVYVDVEDINSATNHSSGTITGWDVNLFFGGVGEFNQANFQPVRVNAADPGSAILNLPLGTPIDVTSPFATGVGSSGDLGSEHVGFGASQFQPNSEGYIGFRLNGGQYGWMRVSFTFDDTGAVVHDWAYDDAGSAIFAGMVPEPDRSVLLLMGLISVISRRRRKPNHSALAPLR
jgi:hypothetical protein